MDAPEDDLSGLSGGEQGISRQEQQLEQQSGDLLDVVESPLSEVGEDVGAFNEGEKSNGDAAIKVEDGSNTNDNTTATTLRPAPQPSVKRRESESAPQQPQVAATSKKRKRRPSPPWQFPTAETSTLKSVDGRRISARVNTSSSTPVLSENDAARGRSSSLSAPPTNVATPGRTSASRAASPPWKKFAAEGPTTVVVDGKRKSGRVNRDLTDPPKRVSPRSAKKQDGRPTSSGKAVSHHAVHNSPRVPAAKKVKKEPEPESSWQSSDRAARIAELRAQIEALQPSRSFTSPEQPAMRSHKRKQSDDDAIVVRPASPKLTRPHRPALSPESHRPAPRIKLRFNGSRRVIDPPHPNAKPPSPVLPPRPSLFQVIESFELLELQQPYTENERGPPDMPWFQQRAERQAVEEAAMRKRILEEAKPGGKLSKECLDLWYDAEPQEEPPKQYGHHDHLVAHALFLRGLQVKEKLAHRQLAKKVAYEAQEMWKARRGPTEEDLREEADKIFRLIYKQCVADVKAKWGLVEAFVQQRKEKAWEEQEELKRLERLREKLEWSEYMVARQRGEGGSGSEEDEDDDEDESGDESSSEEENMSESGSEEADDEDAEAGEMGEEELRAYLAQREAEAPDPGGPVDEGGGEGSLAEMLGDHAPRADGDTSMLDVDGTPDAGAEQQLQDQEDTMAALFAEDQMDADDEAADTEFQPADPPADEEPPTDTERVPSRRSRQTSTTPAVDGDDETNLSSDESTDMDSTDYDSDEDMSSTGEEDNAGEGDEDEEDASGDEQPIPKNSLLSLFKDDVKKWAHLPTPTTSAEGDEREGPTTELEQVDTTAGADEAVQEIEQLRQDSIQEEAMVDHTSAPSSPSVEEDAAVKNLVPQPALLRGTLRSYQHAGLDWLASLYRAGTNGILADEMGLGKTIQTISLLAHLAEVHEVWAAHLVIVPTSVILNWVTEFQKFLPGFRVLGYYGTAEERQIKRKGWVNDPHHPEKDKRGYNVIVTSYNVAMQDINAIRNVQWHYLVLDEAHNIRNFNSQRWQVLIRLKTRARLLLTGTPLQNSLTELWSLLTFLTAGDDDPAHGDLEEFLSHWKDPVREIFDRGAQTLSNESQRVVEQLHISLRPFLLRRLKSEVEKDLPKKTEEVVVCKLSKRQRQLYQEYMGLAETRKNLTQGNAVSAGKVLLSLRRVCNHPDLFDPRAIETSFALESSPLGAYEVAEGVVRRLLLSSVTRNRNVPSLLRITAMEGLRGSKVKRARQLDARKKLDAEVYDLEKSLQAPADTDGLAGCRAMQRYRIRQEKLAHLRSCITISEESMQAAPVYGSELREVLTLRNGRCYRINTRDTRGRTTAKPLRGWPALGRSPLAFGNDHPSDWILSQSSMLQKSVKTTEKYAEDMHDTIVRFAFVTPIATAPILNHAIPPRLQDIIRASDCYPTEADPFHEPRTRTTIAFPDSRLLIYDSGKLQRLTYLLRDLQAQHFRSLIFTQMTGTLNILEQFLNLLNLPYLRLDGSTPVERRALYAAEFNRPDSKYQCMILSSRAGGIGLNLTGASSVIFYDLDWNPQMDRQCMDRAHRIGQVRDVRVFKMVSEKTVEENILRRAQQKSLLDQTVIQEGHFTTDFHREERKEVDGEDGEGEEDVEMAIERFLGSGDGKRGETDKVLESVEDKEDVAAAQSARKEERLDEVDFAERHSSKGPSRAQTPGKSLGEGVDEEADAMEGHVDGYMLRQMERMLEGVVFVPPQAPGRKDRHGRDRSHRPRRRR